MKVYYDEKHIDVTQYDDQGPAIERIELLEGKSLQIFSDVAQIIFVGTGTLSLSCNGITNKKVKKEESVLLPLQNPCVFTALADAEIFAMKLNSRINLHNHLPDDLLSVDYRKARRKGGNIGFLKSNQRTTEFVNSLKNYIKDGIQSIRFYDVKLQEFLFIVKAYFDKQQVIDFFAPVHNKDYAFLNDVSVNYAKVKTVKELAVLLDYSLSGFEKKFKRVFDISPYQWMQEQKAKKIYHEVSFTRKTFTKLAEEYKFSSPAHFNDFCRNYFDSTPGKLRKKMK